MSLDPQNALDVFFSYSHKDEELRDALETHLAQLKRDGAIRTWHDRKIDAGEEWKGEIEASLESADLILLLISPDFIASEFCYVREMTRAIERHGAGEARVIPIILRPCDWQSAPFGKLQGLPKDVRPITSWANADEAYLDVAQGIRAAVEKLCFAKAAEAPPPAIPADPDQRVRDLSKALETAYEERAELEAQGESIRAIDKAIVGLKREMREDGHLKEGDFLADGRFKLQGILGHGGFAEVWKAFDRERKELVAVKVLHTPYGRDRSRRERFFRGARQMARLRHPGVVDVLEEKLKDGGYHFFVMEYVPGGDFRQAVLAGKLTIEERLGIVLEVGEVLAFAHERGVIHRDVKPANILLDLDGRPKLTDFDLVRAADTTGGTRTSMLGTFLYAAPEAMMDGKQAAAPADVYGLGMTALFALHGSDLPGDVLWELPEFLDDLEVNEACRKALRRAVERKIEKRWDGVAVFCEALGKSLIEPNPEKPSPPPEEKSPPSQRPVRTRSEEPPATEPIREYVNAKDGSVLVYVPGGKYTLGADDVDDDSKPVHTVELSPFWIGKNPVTNEQFGRFLEATGHRQPEYWTNDRFNDPQQPVVGVSWQDAKAYCEWAGLELPTEAQWEAAARGTDERRYPWGNEEPSHELANYQGGEGRSTPVDAHPKGAGPFGTLDQAGNVWEWCEDVWNKSAYDGRDGQTDPVETAGGSSVRVLRGGAWNFPSGILPSAFRSRFRAGDRYQYFGFRVVCGSVPEP